MLLGYVTGIYLCCVALLDQSPRRQHPLIIFGDRLVHLIVQVGTFKGDISSAFLKVTHTKELIFVLLLVGIITYMVHQSPGRSIEHTLAAVNAAANIGRVMVRFEESEGGLLMDLIPEEFGQVWVDLPIGKVCIDGADITILDIKGS